MRRLLCVVGIMVCGVATGAAISLQSRPYPAPPNLSGRWTMEGQGPETILYSPLGAEFTVKQDASTITLTSSRGAATYELDDSETTLVTTTVRGDKWTRVSRARFVTFALVITTRIDAGPTGHWEDLLVLSAEGPERLTLVSTATSKSMEKAMITRTFRFSRN